MEKPKYILGIEIAYRGSTIFLLQCKYALDLLTETGMLDCKPADTPMILNERLGNISEWKCIDLILPFLPTLRNGSYNPDPRI